MTGGVAVAAWLLAATLAAPQAHADGSVELGGYLGLHIFAEDNEIGVPDYPDAPSPANSAIIGFRLGYAVNHMFTLEGEAGFIPSKVRGSTAELLSLVYRLQALVHFTGAENDFRPFAALGAGGMSTSSSDRTVITNDSDFVIHGGLGAKYRLGDSWGLRGDLRLLLPPSSASESVTQDFEALVGIYKTFSWTKRAAAPRDSDGDGIPDDEDQCPDEPEDFDGFQDEDGCPDPDNDGDGIPDDKDQCPNEPEDMDGFQDEDGCPDPDNDGDGIPDALDQCPDDAEDMDGFQDEDGCPDPDNDGDGIPDDKDLCPNDAEDMDGFQDEDGCPDLDNDGDGIPDDKDQCPNEPETVNGYQDEDGCPDEVPIQVRRFTGTIQGITFQSNQATVRRPSYRTLNAAVKVLNEYPAIRLEISGHTDNTGDAEYNRDLSRQRAEAVRAYLINKGVDAGRIEAKGYGPDRPVADNKTRAGRAKNRRVEFRLLSQLVEDADRATKPDAAAPADPDAAPPAAPDAAPPAAPDAAPPAGQ